jgi:MerR family copper efflux transcriptional regulator
MSFHDFGSRRSIPVLRTYRIGELAEAAQVSKRTIDYYTQIGLLQTSRSASNYRYYSEDALDRLKLIETFKQQKLTLEEIKQRLQLMDEHHIAASQLTEKVADICNQIGDLENQLLELKPVLSELHPSQLQTFTRQMTIRCSSLILTFQMLFGDSPFF